MEKEVEEVLSRGVGEFIDPEGRFKEKLLKKAKGEYDKDVVIKLGVDPSRPDIHLGHAVILRRLRQFQDLGCKVIFIVGDFTAKIGDPSGKNKTRPEIEQAEIDRNAKTYIDQVGKILRTDKEVFSWIRNADWFTNITDINLPSDYKVEMDIKTEHGSSKIPIPPNSFVGKSIVFEQSRMQVRDLGIRDGISVITLSNFLWTLRNITYSRIIERDLFQDRIKAGEELHLHEMMYPVLQGLDSYVLSRLYGSCDLEMGGTDQTFNMLIGRDIMKDNKVEPQSVLSMEILPGLDGDEKMSKSLDNYISITESPHEMFGKVMSLPDKVMVTYFKLSTYTPTDEIEEIKKSLESTKVNPRDIKLRLAKEITAIYHGEKDASEASENFIQTFSKGALPENIMVVKASRGEKIGDLILSQGLVESKTEWKRLVSDNAVENIEKKEKINDPESILSEAVSLRIGKHRFIRLELL